MNRSVAKISSVESKSAEKKRKRAAIGCVSWKQSDETGVERDLLVQEAQELMNIFGAIVRKTE